MTDEAEAGPEIALAPELASVIAAAKAHIGKLLQRDELRDDPLRYPLEAQLVSLDAFHKLFVDTVLKVGAAAQTVPGLSPDDVARIGQDAARGAEGGARAAAGARRLRTVLLTSVGGLCALVATGIGAGWAGYQEALRYTDIFRSMSASDAQQWLVLMHSNTSIVRAVGECGKTEAAKAATTPDGRHACTVPLYLDPKE